MRDLATLLDYDIAVAFAALDDDNAPAALDLAGYDSAVLGVFVGAGGITFTTTNKIEVKIYEGDTTTFGSASLVAAADLILPSGLSYADGVVKSMVAAKAAASLDKIGYIGNKRYLFVLFDFGGSHSSPTLVGATLIKGHPRVAPV